MNRLEALLDDLGVLRPVPLLEIFGWAGAASSGGTAVVPWRGEHVRARAAGARVLRSLGELGPETFEQCLVHLQKSRGATWAGLACAWQHLVEGGQLLLCGGNELGVKSAVRRLAAELEQQPAVLTNRARGRVVAFTRSEGAGPVAARPGRLAVEAGGERLTLFSAPGVFSADAVDPGSRLLLDHLGHLWAPDRLFDPGCGLGVLGLAALRLFPEASAVLADADWRAVDCARRNADWLDLAARCEVVWWDAVTEAPPDGPFDLVLVNPPFHAGVAVDLAPARAMFRAVDRVLAPNGVALIVANRTLPYERDLAPLGRLGQVAVGQGYKLLLLRR